jgi:mannose-6-phosphate isomerase-like protein (cupin superfamily)
MNSQITKRVESLLGTATLKFLDLNVLLFLLFTGTVNSQGSYLKRSISQVPEMKMEISTNSAHYKALFGAGDDSSGSIKAINRYGNLTIDPMGSSRSLNYSDEELVLFVLDGTGILEYDKKEVPVSKNDFIYIPVGTKFGLSNPRERSLSVILMGFKIFPGTNIKTTPGLMIANADEVPFQVLGQHGPTTLFQLLMGNTESKRDRLAAAYQVNSLFIMDFAVNGTNIPHRHDNEEEIYFILRGQGEIVAGVTGDEKESRHPAKDGDAYFFSQKTLIGFYSGNKDGEEHAKILAVRFKCQNK